MDEEKQQRHMMRGAMGMRFGEDETTETEEESDGE